MEILLKLGQLGPQRSDLSDRGQARGWIETINLKVYI